MPKRYSAADARRDVGSKDNAQIERESSSKWARLALEAYRRHAAGKGLQFLLDAETYRQEALEHAAQVGDGGKLVGELGRRFAKIRPRIR